VGKLFDTWIGSRLSGAVTLIGVVLVVGPASLAYYRDASTAVKVVIAFGLVLIAVGVVLEWRKRVTGGATMGLRDASARVTDFLRARAARAGGEPAAEDGGDWLRHHHGDAAYQRETVALYYDLHRRVVLDALDRPRVAKEITQHQRRFVQQPRTVEDIWATAELLSATYRTIKRITDPAYLTPYDYSDRKPDDA
jgi:hypothetical protein